MWPRLLSSTGLGNQKRLILIGKMFYYVVSIVLYRGRVVMVMLSLGMSGSRLAGHKDLQALTQMKS